MEYVPFWSLFCHFRPIFAKMESFQPFGGPWAQLLSLPGRATKISWGTMWLPFSLLLLNIPKNQSNRLILTIPFRWVGVSLRKIGAGLQPFLSKGDECMERYRSVPYIPFAGFDHSSKVRTLRVSFLASFLGSLKSQSDPHLL